MSRTVVLDDRPGMPPLTIHEPRKPSELATDVANVLERYGWTTGMWGGPNVGFCLYGAFQFVAVRTCLTSWDMADVNRAYQRTLTKLAEVIGIPPGYLLEWNDTKCKGRDELVSALRTTAEKFAADGD